MARRLLTNPLPGGGIAVSYELTHAYIDFKQGLLGGTVQLLNANDVVLRTIHRTGTFVELGISQTTADNIEQRIVDWLKSLTLVN